MASFTYNAKDLSGLAHSGIIESADERAAAAILRKKGLVVISVNQKSAPRANIFDKFFNRVKFNDLVTITRQLSTMVSSGLVLSEAIDILEEQQDSKKLKKVLGDVSSDIKGGFTLAEAFGRHKDVFPQIYINLIRSGEKSGKLDEVLLKMADSLEKDREFRARIKGALIYPAVVITMMIAVIILMMTFVIPRLTSLYSESSIELPLPTKILIASSKLFTSYWWIMIIVTFTVILGVRRWIKTPDGRLAFDKILLRIPIVGKIITNVSMTNFNRTFGLLTGAGVPLLEAIGIVQDITGNVVYKNILKETYSGVERGLTLSSQLINSSVFPRIVGQMVRVGEETGKIDSIFNKLADYFESESDHLVKNLTVAIEPIILVILGIGVAFLVISIILPIYKLTTSF